ncbi:MAG TPA: hypothetical protein VK929_10025 [Longimicrobiales bacterium]|nr:hypothetical protein [Longimicrobiales bacterium]
MHRLLRYIPLAAVLVLAACDDPFGPQPWNPNPVEITLYSASRPAYIGLVSALDLATDPVGTIAIEAPGATGQWDVVLVDGPGGLSLAPASSFEGLSSMAAIATLEGQAFIDVEEAPRESAAYSTEPVLLRTDVIYIIRSRRAPCGFTTGPRYAKVQPIEIDEEQGIFRFAILRNPFCDDRALVPPPAN